MEELVKLNMQYMEQNIELWEKIGMLEERIRWMEQRFGYGESKVVRLQPLPTSPKGRRKSLTPGSLPQPLRRRGEKASPPAPPQKGGE